MKDMKKSGIYQITGEDLFRIADQLMVDRCKHIEIPSKVAANILKYQSRPCAGGERPGS